MGQGAATERPEANAEHPSYTTVYQAAGGWQSMCVAWTPSDEPWATDGGFEETWATGQGPYRFKREAIAEARAWAEEWGIEYREGEEGPEEAPGLEATLAACGLRMTEIEVDPEEPFDEATRQTVRDVRAACADPSLLTSEERKIQEALQGAARELEREHGYRVFVLDTIEVEPGSKPV